MRVRSWMTALIVVVATTAWPFHVVLAQKTNDSKAKQPASPKVSQTAKPVDESPISPDCHAVRLQLKVAGLNESGCDVNVKPGSRSCRFRPQGVHVGSDGFVKILFRDVELRGADRNCTFSITIQEPGRDSRTVFRGCRIPSQAADTPAPKTAQVFTCFVNAPSKLAGLERTDHARK